MSRRLPLTALALFLSAPTLALAEGIEVHDAYAIVSRPGAPNGAAFMAIHNHGTTDDHLLSVASPVAARVELHTHVIDANGVAQMMEVEEGWPLPAGGEILLDRGGNHIMFMGITDPFEDGDILPVTLVFETAGEVMIEVEVDLDRLGGGGMQHGMDHGAPATGG